MTAALRTRGRCLVMGVVNVTPDSFSDGGRVARAGRRGRARAAMLAEGADLLDVGGESTRPGAEPGVRGRGAAAGAAGGRRAGRRRGARQRRHHARRGGRAALEAGARAGQRRQRRARRPGDAALVADAGVPYVLMHWRGHSPRHAGARGSLRRHRPRGARRAARAGRRTRPGRRRRRTSWCSTPGSGFAKTADHNWAVLASWTSCSGSAGRCWSGRRASVPRPPARRCRRHAPPGRRAATPPPPRPARWPPRPGSGRAGARGAARASMPSAWRGRGASGARDVTGRPTASGPDRADRAARPRFPRRLRSSAARGRTSSSTSSCTSTPRRRPRPTTSPTPCTTASWPSSRRGRRGRAGRPDRDAGRAAREVCWPTPRVGAATWRCTSRRRRSRWRSATSWCRVHRRRAAS